MKLKFEFVLHTIKYCSCNFTDATYTSDAQFSLIFHYAKYVYTFICSLGYQGIKKHFAQKINFYMV